MKQSVNFEVSVLFTQEDSCWVAQCLQYDIAAQGKTLKAAKEAFERTFIGQVIVDLKHGLEPLADTGKAPQEFWDMFDEGDKLAEPKPLKMPGDVLPGFMVNATANDLRIYA